MSGARWILLPTGLLLLLAMLTLQQTMTKSATVEVGAKPDGPDGLFVQWTLNDTISDQVTFYIISWSGEGEGEAGSESVDNSTTTYIITGLVPCTNYTITVQPTVGSSSLGDPGNTAATTSKQAPTPVSSVTPTTVLDNSHQLNVSWTLSMDIGRCPGYYKINWNGTQEGEAEVQNIIRYNIIGLDTWTLYHVCVDSGQDQDSLYSKPKCKNGRTDEDSPGPPQNVRVSGATTSESLTVEWNPPAAPNGVITSYSVTWSPDDGTADTTDTTYTLTGLLPCTTYTVTVSAATSKGYGPSDNTSDTTQPAAPGPPTAVSVDMVLNQSDSLTVTWTQPGTRCDITNNTITWVLNSMVDSVTVEPTDHYTISDLDPWTTYLVCVKAVTLGGDGPHAPCLNRTTDEDTPGPPADTSASALNFTSVKVTWEKPSNPNGNITEYLIEWSFESDNVSKEMVDSPTTEFIVTNLIECIMYNFTVTAATSKGLGDTPGTTQSTTETQEPPPPNKVTCTAPGATVLTTTWSTPTSTCDVTQYIVSYVGHVLWSNNTKANNSCVDPSKNSIDLTGLVPWTSYNVCVKAEIIGWLAGDQSCCLAITEQTAPGPPASLKQTGSSTKSVSVTWTPPEELNGNLSGYCLTWELGHKNLTQSDHSTTIDELKAGTSYNVTLQAVTGGSHLGRAMQQDVKTKNSLVGAIVGGMVAGLVLVAVAGATYVYRDRLKTGMRKQATRTRSTRSPITSVAVASPQSSAPPPLPPKTFALELVPVSNWSEGEVSKNEINQYIQYLEEDTHQGLQEEYALLKDLSPQHPTHAATRDFNKPKNRFINILPFDQTRVKLPLLPASPGSDYINASYIADMHNGYYFVASQGPKSNTVDDFWRMVWELKVYTIVMLTNLKEKGKDKCAQYWPSSGEPPLRCDSITVSNQAEDDGDYHIVRYLVLDMGEKKRVVKQYHFNTWPDFGVPSHEHNLLDFKKVVHDSMTTSSKHIVVHCSAGVGRTGTFIGLWNLMDTVEGETAASTVNMRRAVLNMRECRPSMVQSQEQYLYLWKCVAAYVDNPQRWKPKNIGDNHVYDNAAYCDPIYDNLKTLHLPAESEKNGEAKM